MTTWKITLGSKLRCGCNGSHVNIKTSESPKLEGIPSTEALSRILKTPQWRGSSVRTEVRDVMVEARPKRSVRTLCFIITHPSGADLVLRGDLA